MNDMDELMKRAKRMYAFPLIFASVLTLVVLTMKTIWSISQSPEVKIELVKNGPYEMVLVVLILIGLIVLKTYNPGILQSSPVKEIEQ